MPGPSITRRQPNNANVPGTNRSWGATAWRKNRNRNRNRGRPQGFRDTHTNATDARNHSPGQGAGGQLAPLSAAKGVIKSRLSVMFRGLRGIEAAQQAFDLCGVELGFHIQDKSATTQPPEGAGRGRDRNNRNRPFARDSSMNDPQEDNEQDGDSQD